MRGLHCGEGMEARSSGAQRWRSQASGRMSVSEGWNSRPRSGTAQIFIFKIRLNIFRLFHVFQIFPILDFQFLVVLALEKFSDDFF